MSISQKDFPILDFLLKFFLIHKELDFFNVMAQLYVYSVRADDEATKTLALEIHQNERKLAEYLDILEDMNLIESKPSCTSKDKIYRILKQGESFYQKGGYTHSKFEPN